jgi:hypothetical protein
MTPKPEMTEIRLGPGNAALVRMTSSAITLADLDQADADAADHVLEHPGEDFSVISVGRYVGFRDATAESMRLRARSGWVKLLFSSYEDFQSFTELLWRYGWETLDAS